MERCGFDHVLGDLIPMSLNSSSAKSCRCSQKRHSFCFPPFSSPTGLLGDARGGVVFRGEDRCHLPTRPSQ